MSSCENGYSMAMWLKPAETVPVGVILSSGGNSNRIDPSGVAVKFEANNALAFLIRVKQDKKIWRVPHTLSGSDWIHVALTWKANNAMKVYVNGSLVGEVPGKTYTLGPTNNAPNMVIGAHMDGVREHGQFLLDELYVWDEELEETELTQIFESYDFTGLSIY